VIRRRDGLFAYQLAVVVDDIEAGVNHVVRGADILDSTPRQNYLYHCLGKKPPQYFHLPLVIDENGHKYSKSKLFPAVKAHQACDWLQQAYFHLGQSPAIDFDFTEPKDFLSWAIKNFRVDKISRKPIAYQTGHTGKLI